MPNSLENQFIADTFERLLHTGDVSLRSGAPDAILYTGDGFESSLSISTPTNGIKVDGNATIYGSVISYQNGSFSGTLDSGSHSVNGNSNIRGTLNSGSHTVNGNSNINGNTRIVGNATINGVLSSGSHTVNGDINIRGVLNSGSHTVNGSSNITGVLNSGSHSVNGNSNIYGNARIVGSATINASLSSGSHTVVGNSRITNRIDTNVIYADTYLNLPVPDIDQKTELVDHFYPVGSVFLSFTNANPSTRFTGTTWVQAAQGRFIVGVGTGNDGIQNNTFNAGNNSGEYQHKLTISEMPKHRHNLRHPDTGEQFYIFNDQNYGGGGAGVTLDQGPDDKGDARYYNFTNYEGDSGYHNNNPPGYGLYVWRRTS